MRLCVAGRGLIGVVTATGMLAGALAGLAWSAGETGAGAATTSCVAPAGAPVLTLSDTSPSAKVSLPLGFKVVVQVPKWSWGHATEITNSSQAVLRQICSTLTNGGGRTAVFLAQRLGTSQLSATVAPASNLMMPSWLGVVTVTDAPRYPSQAIGAGDVFGGRFVRTVVLDGGAFTVTPAPSSLKPGMWSAHDVASVLWATWQLRGYTAQVLGFGLVTITRNTRGVPSVTRLPAWVGLAAAPLTVTSCYAIPVNTKLPHVPDAGEAAVVFGDPVRPKSGTFSLPPAVVYTAATAHCTTLIRASVVKASDLISDPWVQAGAIKDSKLSATISLPGGGRFIGYKVSGDSRTLTVMTKGLIPVQAWDAIYPGMSTVRLFINLGANWATATKITHAALGRLQTVRP